MNRIKTIATSLVLYPTVRLLVFKLLNAELAIDKKIIIQTAVETVLFVAIFNLVLWSVQPKK